MSALDPVTAVAKAISEITATIREWAGGAPTRKMKRAIEYGERYIRLASQHTGKLDKKVAEQLKDIEDDFFKNN